MQQEKARSPGTPAQAPRYFPHLTRFFFLAYAISWVIWAPLLLEKLGLIGPVPFSRVLFLLGGLGPISAAMLMAHRVGGTEQVKRLLSPLVAWRAGIGWYVYAIFLPMLLLGGGNIADAIAGQPQSITGASVQAFLVGVAWRTAFIGVEEVGWRGFALPALQAKYGFVRAALILGLFWSLWHLPLFGFNPSHEQSGGFAEFLIGFGMFTVTATIASFLLSFLWNRTGGNLLLCCLFHAVNNSFGTLVGEPGNQLVTLGLTVLALLLTIHLQTRRTHGIARAEFVA